MYTIIKHISHLLIFIGSILSIGYSQCDFTPPDSALRNSGKYYSNNGKGFNPEGKYYEGIRNEPIASGTLVLKSLNTQIYGYVEKKTDWFYINFHVPCEMQGESLCILIEDLQTGYYVVPYLDEFSEGHHTFSWNSKRLFKSLGLELLNLNVTIRKKDLSNGKIYIPANLAYSVREILPKSHTFSFMADTKGKCSFYISKDLVDSKDFVKNQSIPFTWDCIKKESGLYEGIVEYSFEDAGTELLPFKFYHIIP